MSSYVQPNFPQTRGSATRLSHALNRARASVARLGNPATLASLLVAGGLAAVIVVAEQVVSAWADGHLLLAWIAMWLIVFGLLALFSGTIRSWPAQWQAQWQARRLAAGQRAADDRTWEAALADPRLMAELDSAWLRAQQLALAKGQEMPLWPFASRSRYLAPRQQWA